MNSDFLFEYEYCPLPDAEERLAQAWDLILAIILEDYESEQKEKSTSESNPC
jgi:hypothetical protein